VYRNLKIISPLLLLITCVQAFADEKKSIVGAENINSQTHLSKPENTIKKESHLPFFIGASYTYWKPYQTAINIAYSPGSLNTVGTIIRPKISAVSGFKVAAGTHTYHDAWNVNVNYTWFTHTPGTSSNNLENNNNINYGSPYFGLPILTYADLISKFSVQFNRIDGLVEKNIHLTKRIIFSPWIGLLGAWDNENLNFDANILIIDDKETSKMNQFWWGIGPYTGTKISFFCTKSLALYLSYGTSLLFTEHRLKAKNLLIFSDDNSTESIANYYTDFHNVEPMLESSIGLAWGTKWEKCGLCLHLSWDLQTYFNHSGFLPFFSAVGILGDYSMQGLTAGVQVDF
jgi:hypothetical protein